jgi:hypothetical protein
MALELEDTIMTEIGLGNHYNWFNGSGSCRYLRIESASRLESTIKKHADAGDKIAQPDNKLINLAIAVAGSLRLDRDYELTRTWEVCSYIIAAHIHEAGRPGAIKETIKFLKNSDRYNTDEIFIRMSGNNRTFIFTKKENLIHD